MATCSAWGRVGAGMLAAAALLMPADARAFCGFYVGGADAKLFNNATQVVLLREGTRTVLSMANNYQGPPENFAMVVPVPVVLQKENVKTLARTVFDHIDRMGAPRLVEYWEQDPCPAPRPTVRFGAAGLGAGMAFGSGAGAVADKPTVRIEAQFTVGEYEVVILSADDSMALDTWLRQNGYKIPAGAGEVLKPYVLGGMKFFVAKVDPKKVTFENGQAMLSPLRFFYDSELFSLPVRLGLLNSNGTQDLIVNILARGQRYEVANYPNVAIPTNLDVLAKVKSNFGAFYAALFDQTAKKHPGAVITEYSWTATSCDPCPGPPLNVRDLSTFGFDALQGLPPGRGAPWVLTRLHARYGKDTLGEDLVFKEAPPIVGGREFLNDNGRPETTARSDAVNNFQARYAIRYRWTGPIACKNPQRGMWGGPPGGFQPTPTPATNLAFAPRGAFALAGNVAAGSIDPFQLSAAGKVASTIPVALLAATTPPAASSAPEIAPPAPSEAPPPGPSAPAAAPAPPAAPSRGGCAGCGVGASAPGAAALSALALAALGGALRRRRRAGDA